METHTAQQGIVKIFAIAVGFSLSTLTGLAYIYGGDFGLSIPAQPDRNNAWMGQGCAQTCITVLRSV